MADKEKIAGEILSGMGPGLLSGIGNALNPTPTQKDPTTNAQAPTPSPLTKKLPAFKKGGRVPKTEVAVVHKGETVIPAEESISLHRALHHLNKGGLHRALGVQEGQPIPKDKLAAAKKSTNPHVKKMADFASTMEGWKH